MKKFVLLTLIAITNFALSFADTTYVVEKGDTLYSISRKNQITVAELRTANNLSENDVLKAGQKIIIPEADIGTAAALSSSNQKSAPKVSSNAQTSSYVVQKGDTLYGIARKNGMKVPELLALNNLDNNAVIKVGQKLKISSGSQLSQGALPSSTSKTTPVYNQDNSSPVSTTTIRLDDKAPDTRTYGSTVSSDANTKWPVKNPRITSVKGKVSGVQLSASQNEKVLCIHEGTVMYVGVYRGFGQVLFVQSKTGLIYAYTGLGSVNVKKGDYAVSGADLGTAGVDPISGKPGITFMVFQNGQPIDPRTAPRN
ncbi:metalloendopeptidase-like membrane protein [Treponema sp. JC4]|jgi:LysM repeat protein|uniref:M23 family metallopeptidase n=1 Tax=Treponema sp. JC4 TaxID=1124982 RepID=UPI00025B077C|nr:M23 family metallopeptidase [Treponema sp. JC4]EID84463.1 metalloendopeptidase-like membrane protein [Treponema sp. JC4]